MRVIAVPKIVLWTLLAALNIYPSVVVGRTHMYFVNDTRFLQHILSNRLGPREPGYHAELRMVASSLKSKKGETETAIHFRNDLDEPVFVYWLDYNGEEIRYKMLKPGEEYTQHTYVTHPWIVRRSSNHEIVGRMVARIDTRTLNIVDRKSPLGGSERRRSETPTNDTNGKDLYWAVAVGHIPGTAIPRPYYGAAWNVSTAEEAEKLAIDECHKKGPDCIYADSGKNSCFVVGQYPNWVFLNTKHGNIRPYEAVGAPTIRQALLRANRAPSRWGPFQPVLQECVGGKSRTAGRN